MKFLFFLTTTLCLSFSAYTSNLISTDSVSKSMQPDLQVSIPQEKKPVLSTEASYISDVCGNFAGGKKKGVLLLGMGNLRLETNLENLGLWKGATLFANGAFTHGKSPSEELTGDFQVFSNIAAGDHIYLHELWYRQSIQAFEITIGLQDLNVEFIASRGGGMFINSSFGVPPVLSANVPAPIFPLTAPGITLKYNPGEHLTAVVAAYDGCPTAFEHNLYNTRWHFNQNDGMLAIAELQWDMALAGNTGTIKVGSFYHTGLLETNSETGESAAVFNNNFGTYLIADQQIVTGNTSDEGLHAFAQIAYSPLSCNAHQVYWGGGLVYSGITLQPEDALGLALAHAAFTDKLIRSETALELFYKKSLSEKLFVQPDIQYIINPSGSNKNLSNALAGILRISLSF